MFLLVFVHGYNVDPRYLQPWTIPTEPLTPTGFVQYLLANWYEVAVRWLFFPVSYQLWFIRVLFICNLAYPLIARAIMQRNARYVFFAVVALFWLATLNLDFVEGEGLLFFALGVWIQKTDFSIESPQPWLNPTGWFIAFVGLATLKTWLAFRGQPLMGDYVYPLITLLHKGTVISGLIACWFGGDAIVRWCMARPWFVWLSAFSFMIYALHAPLVAYLIDPAIEVLQPMPATRLLAFILLPLPVIAVCVATGATLRKFTPGFYGLLTGGRGTGA